MGELNHPQFDSVDALMLMAELDNNLLGLLDNVFEVIVTVLQWRLYIAHLKRKLRVLYEQANINKQRRSTPGTNTDG